MSKTETSREIYTANRLAFADIFGDPTATPEAIPGQYQNLKGRGLIAAMKNNFDEGKSTRNPATPSIMDFFIDVENIVKRNLEEGEHEKFTETFLFEGDADNGGFTDTERRAVEQKLGRIFRARKISPSSKYFTAKRQGTPPRRK